MIWFGDVQRILPAPAAAALTGATPRERMRQALEWVAARAPYLTGDSLIEALASTELVDEPTARRLLPEFRHFDPDRHFSDQLRRLSFRGRTAADDFRLRVRSVVSELTGTGSIGPVGPDEGVRFRCSAEDLQGVVLPYPEVNFSIGGTVQQAVLAAAEEMPDALILVARNFDKHAAAQLSALLHQREVPGTLITVNLLLGIRAMTLRYQPQPQRIFEVLGAGRPLRSADIAVLGD